MPSRYCTSLHFFYRPINAFEWPLISRLAQVSCKPHVVCIQEPCTVYMFGHFIRFISVNYSVDFQNKNLFSSKLSMPRLSEDQGRAAVRMLMNGSSQHNVARLFRVHKSTISRLFDRLRTTGTTNDRPRPGRLRVTTRRESAFIRVTQLTS
jgi:hypothetical protein